MYSVSPPQPGSFGFSVLGSLQSSMMAVSKWSQAWTQLLSQLRSSPGAELEKRREEGEADCLLPHFES